MRVVLVDDDEMARRLIGKVLARMGCHVIGEAGDGRQALSLLSTCGPDLVLTDCQMPHMDGIALCRALRSAGNAVPVLMLSGQLDPRVVQLARQAGVTEYLHKPLDLHALRAALDRLGPGN